VVSVRSAITQPRTRTHRLAGKQVHGEIGKHALAFPADDHIDDREGSVERRAHRAFAVCTAEDDPHGVSEAGADLGREGERRKRLVEGGRESDDRRSGVDNLLHDSFEKRWDGRAKAERRADNARGHSRSLQEFEVWTVFVGRGERSVRRREDPVPQADVPRPRDDGVVGADREPVVVGACGRCLHTVLHEVEIERTHLRRNPGTLEDGP
jgi:hypothetical protein